MKFQFTLAALLAAVSAYAQHTNVVFLTIDDFSRESIGLYGCPVDDITPNMDFIGRSGLRFENAHVQAGNCTPSRNQMTTGMYQQHSHVYSLGSEGVGNHTIYPSISDIFRQAGFHTGIMGKNTHMDAFTPYPGFDVEYDGYGSTKEPENVYAKTVQAIADAKAANKPLFYNLNIFDPHQGWYAWDNKDGPTTDTSNPPSRIYTETEVPYPTWFPPISEAEMIGTTSGGTTNVNIMTEVAAYYNTVKRADDSVGKMLQAFEEANEMDNTIFIMFADHGVQLPNAKTALYDHSSRSPLFVKWPGITTSNTVNDTHMIAAIDLLPTFCEIAGQPIPAGRDGRSFLPLIKGESVSGWKPYVMKQQNDRNKMRAIQTQDFLYIFNPWAGRQEYSSVTTGVYSKQRFEDIAATGTNAVVSAWYNHFIYRTLEEFYDMRTDTDCMTNLVDNPAYAADLAAMQDLLARELAATDDTHMLYALTNRYDAGAISNYFVLFDEHRADIADQFEYNRRVFYNPHDDWELLGHTLFEPFGNWGIWTPESASGITLSATAGLDNAGDSCIVFDGAESDISRLVVNRTIDTSIYEQLKLDVEFDDTSAFSQGASIAFQYHDGTNWKTFESITSGGQRNHTFELPGGGLPDKLHFGIQCNFNGSGGKIYMDHTRLTAWQDWGSAPTNAPFDATGLGHIRYSYTFEASNFTTNDSVLCEYYDGSDWQLLREYPFDGVLITNSTYSDYINLYSTEHTFPTNLEFRVRSVSTAAGQLLDVSNISIETRIGEQPVAIDLPPEANPDSYETTTPRAIVEVPPGILGNDVVRGATPTAELVSGVQHGVLNFYSDGSFAYGATNGFVGTDSFDYRVLTGTNYSAAATVSLTTLSGGTNSLPAPLLHLSFDTGLTDSSGNGNHGSYAGSGAGISSSHKFGGGSLDTAGTGYVTFPSLAFGISNTWSISLWYNASSNITAGLAGDNLANNTLSYNAAGPDRSYYLRGNHRTGNGTWTTINSPTALDTGVWHHLVVTADGLNAVQVYEDGVLLPDAWNGDPDNGMTFNRIGNDGSTVGWGGTFNGLIDEVRIMDYILTPDQIEDLYIKNGQSLTITNFNTWNIAHGLSGNDALPDADTDGDFAANILEYAFNLIPGVKDAVKLPEGGTSGLPRGELKPGTGDRLQFEYIRRKKPGDIDYGVQFSDNLMSNWLDATLPETIDSINEDWERVIIEDNLTIAETTNRFGRVIVVAN